MSDRLDYCGVAVSRLTASAFVARMAKAVDDQRVLTATYLHFHTVNLIEASPHARHIFSEIDVVHPDGIAVLWSSRLFGRPFDRDNILVMECIMPTFAVEASRRAWTLFLFGGAAGVAERAKEKLEGAFPQMRVVGTHHGYLRLEEEMRAVVAMIARARPTIVLVALGQPMQEEWIVRYRDQLNARVIIGVGGYLDKLAKRAEIYPGWVERTHLYWFYRLLTEPARVWKRYSIGGVQFARTLLRAKVRQRGQRAGSGA